MGVDPGLVILKIEIRHAHQKVVGAEPGEGLQQGLGFFKVAFEGGDIGRFRSHEPPTEDADSMAFSQRKTPQTARPNDSAERGRKLVSGPHILV